MSLRDIVKERRCFGENLFRNGRLGDEKIIFCQKQQLD
jgi:hypothetical protein